MAPKKKKAKKTMAVDERTVGSITKTYAPTILPIGTEFGSSDTANWITLEMKLIGWSYMDFSLTVRTDVYLVTLKQSLKQRHGRMENLKLYRHGAYDERHEMNDNMRTLAEYGVTGGPNKHDAPSCVIHYDFRPSCGGGGGNGDDSDHRHGADPDPVLLSWVKN